MNQQKSDQEWQQLQAHIEGFLGQALRNDTQRIEYRPKYIGHLAMISKRQQSELLDKIAISDNCAAGKSHQ